jgi:aldehyde dehydrogenase (NAD+)
MANDTPYGLAASVWTESVNLALDVAPAIKAGTVWVNCTNLFDAASGFGGYRESGYGREGGKEGLWEYVRPRWELGAPPLAADAGWGGSASGVSGEAVGEPTGSAEAAPGVDRTPKLYIGGKQKRPDGMYTVALRGPGGEVLGEVPRGNRKDVRDAVEAARGAQRSWAARTAHNRAQVLFYLAENLASRTADLIESVEAASGRGGDAAVEVDEAVRRLFSYAAWADKWDGRVHHTPFRNVTLAMPEPLGVVGVVCPEGVPLLGLVSTVAPVVAMGNAAVVVPSLAGSLVAADLYQLLDTSDVPGGVVNIVTGYAEEVVPTLADHDDVDGIWYFGTADGAREVERRSTGNMKRTWTGHGVQRDWLDRRQSEGEEFLREATQVKNIWVPYGE